VLTVADAKAIEREAPSAGTVDVCSGGRGHPGRERAYYKGEQTKELSIIGVSENYAAVNFMEVAGGRFFTESEVQHRRAVVVLGETPMKALFRTSTDRQGHPGGVGAVRDRRLPGEAGDPVRRRRRRRLPRRAVHDVREAVRVAAQRRINITAP